MKDEYLKKGRVKQKQETREKILSCTQELMNCGKKYVYRKIKDQDWNVAGLVKVI